MSQDVAEFEKLLNNFKKVYDPKTHLHQPSYLEICDYPGRRTEEICSRMFAFFFDTQNPHGMGTLFWDTLVDVYKEKCNDVCRKEISNLSFSKCHAEREVPTKKGRIDLLLSSDNCVICIENKLWADLDNDLDDYYEYTNGIKSQRIALYAIISMREDIKVILDSKANLKYRQEFVVIFYREFIEKLKQNLGDYLTTCSAKYFSMLLDWIQFLDYQGGYMSVCSKGEQEFFVNNDEMLETLIKKRKNFLDKKKKQDAERIKLIKQLLESKDGNMSVEWWIYDDTDLGCHFQKGSREFEIGLESSFDIKDNFNIQISIWNPKKNPQRLLNYQEELSKMLGIDSSDDGKINPEKWFRKFETMQNPTNEKVVDELYKKYNQLKKVVSSAIAKK